MRLFRVIVSAVLLASLTPRDGAALEPERSGQGSFLIRAVVADGQLWTLSDAGVLSTVKLDSRVKVRQNVGEPALDLCVHAGNPEIAIAAQGGNAWTIEHFSDQKWFVEGTIAAKGDKFIALDCARHEIAILTSRRIVTLQTRLPHDVMLSKKLLLDGVVTVLGTVSDLFVGVNAGEWGGGLRRIDRRAGTVQVVERNASGQLCDGPLNTECDPVTGIAIEPWNPKCLVVAIGLEHMTSNGRITEVCSNQVRALYYKRSAHVMRPDCKRQSGEPCQTVAFYGVASRNDEVLAVANDGLYHLRKNGSVSYSRMPRFVPAGDIYLSYDVPGFVVVLTDVNKRLSLSASVPLLVPR